MLRNYLKVAFRHFFRYKTHNIINVTGLAVGLASYIIILLYMNHELSYDSWDDSLKRVYKISERTNSEILDYTASPLAGFLAANSGTVDHATAFSASGDFEVLLAAGEKKIYQKGGVMADSSFFKVFPYKILHGSATSLLNQPNALVITKDLSMKLFGSTDALGKVVRIFNQFDNVVTGVIEKPETPTSLNLEFIWRDPYEKENQSWQNYSFQTYVKTKKNVSVTELEDLLNAPYYDNRLKQNNQPLAAFRNAGHQAGLFAEEIRSAHNFPRHGKSGFTIVFVLMVLAVLLLLTGAINFSNLSVAASVHRLKEAGVRKYLGSGRAQLILQFMVETAMKCFISLLLALSIVLIALPYFNREFNLDLSIFSSGWSIWGQIIVSLIIVTALSGLYPSLLISAVKTTRILKGNYLRQAKGLGFRNVLIVTQFAFAALFFYCSIVVREQMNYMQSKDKGFSGEQVIRINSTQLTREQQFNRVRDMLMAIRGVDAVSKSTYIPGDRIIDTGTVAFRHEGLEYRMMSAKISANYFNTLNIGMVKGRMFANSVSDENTRNAIINETAAKRMNLVDALGKIIYFPDCDTVPVQIVGVVKDFNVLGFENTIQPMVFTMGNKACMFQSGGAILAKVNSNDIGRTVKDIEAAWKTIEPDFPLQFSFINDNFQKLLVAHTRLEKVINFFTLTAIIISLMGLFALTSFVIAQRTKEIAIRKTVGAGLENLAILLSKDLAILIMVAVFIATPVGWLVASKWLEGFAYRIDLNLLMFFLPAVVLIIIAMLTIGLQILKVLKINLIKSLRTE